MMPNTNKALLIGAVSWLAMAPFAEAELKAFQPGDVIKSSEINGNFKFLEGQIEDLNIGAVNSDIDNLESRIDGVDDKLESTVKVIDCNANALALDTALLQEAVYTANTHGINKKFEILGECEVRGITIDGTSIRIVGGSADATIVLSEDSSWNLRYNASLILDDIIFKNPRLIASAGSRLSWGQISFDNPRGIFLIANSSLYAVGPTSLSLDSSGGTLVIAAYQNSSANIKNSEMRYQLLATNGSTFRCYDCIDVEFGDVDLLINSSLDGYASDDQDLSIETLDISFNSTFIQRYGSGNCTSYGNVDNSSVMYGITKCSE